MTGGVEGGGDEGGGGDGGGDGGGEGGGDGGGGGEAAAMVPVVRKVETQQAPASANLPAFAPPSE